MTDAAYVCVAASAAYALMVRRHVSSGADASAEHAAPGGQARGSVYFDGCVEASVYALARCLAAHRSLFLSLLAAQLL